MKARSRLLLRRSVFLAGIGVLVAVLTACTGRGADTCRLTSVAFTGPASFGFTLQLRGQGRREPADRSAAHPALLQRTRQQPRIGSPFGIHGIVDMIDPVLESMICIGQNPPPGGKELIFLGRYRPTTSAPAGFPKSCPTRRRRPTAVPFRGHRAGQRQEPARRRRATSSRSRCRAPRQSPSDLDPATVFYTRAGLLEGGNLTVN